MPGATCPTPKVNTHPRTLSPQQHSHRSSADRLAANSRSHSTTVSLTLPISLSIPADLRGMHRHSVCVSHTCAGDPNCKCTFDAATTEDLECYTTLWLVISLLFTETCLHRVRYNMFVRTYRFRVLKLSDKHVSHKMLRSLDSDRSNTMFEILKESTPAR